jgi:hypothetical protein
MNKQEHDKEQELVARRLKAFDEIVDNRRFKIQQVYGAEAAEKYSSLREEREYFGWHGHLPDAAPPKLWAEARTARERVAKLHAEFFEFCEANYAVQRQMMEDKINARRRQWEASPMYEQQAPQRAAFMAYYEQIGQKWAGVTTRGNSVHPSGEGMQETDHQSNQAQ